MFVLIGLSASTSGFSLRSKNKSGVCVCIKNLILKMTEAHFAFSVFKAKLV